MGEMKLNAQKKIIMSQNVRPNLKIVLLGDSGVGKTSLVFKWVTGLFNEKLKPTIGTNHQVKSIQINGTEVDVFLWDTAGQEQFHALAPLYVRQSSAVIIVTSADNFESQKNIQTWVELVADSCETIPPMILAINKIDLVENINTTCEGPVKEQVKRFPKVFYVSASTGENVDQLFLEASQQGYDFKQTEAEMQPKTVITKEKKDKGCSC